MVTSRHHKAALHPAKSCITTQCKQVPWYCSQLCSNDGTLRRCCARPQINKIMFSGLYDHLDAIHAVICGNFEEPMIEAQTFLESALSHCHFVIFGDRLGSCRKCCAACCRPAGGLQALQRASCLVLARAQARLLALENIICCCTDVWSLYIGGVAVRNRLRFPSLQADDASAGSILLFKSLSLPARLIF